MMRGIQLGNFGGRVLGIAIAISSSLTSSVAMQAAETIQPQAPSGSFTLAQAQGRSAPMRLARSGGNLRLAKIRRSPQGPATGGRIRTGSSRTTDNRAEPSICPKAAPPLTALVSFEEEKRSGKPSKIDVWGYTTAAHPTLWFYMPYTKAQAIPADFTLVEDDSFAIVIPSTPVQLPSKPGIIAVRIPPTAKDLKPGKRYRWALTLNCASSANASDKMQVEGVIVRENLSKTVQAELATAQGVQKAMIYAENDFWHDALTTLAELRQKNLADPSLRSDWQSLLESMMLSGPSQEFKPEELIDQPFTN